MRTALLLFALAALAGCDLLGGGETVVTGTVRLKETGEPLPNIAVSLYDSGGGGSYFSPRIATTSTNEQGYYRIETNENANGEGFQIYANSGEGYNKCYSGGYMSEGAKQGKRTRKDLVLLWSGNCPNP